MSESRTPAGKRRRGKRRRRRPGRFRSWLHGRTARDRAWHRRARRYALVVIPAALLLSIVFLGVSYALVRIPRPSDFAANATTVLDRTGEVIVKLHPEADRIDVPLDRIPRAVRDAVLAVEDKNFYRHRGVSLPSIVRAAFANVTGLGIRQGGSTITQQYVKNAYVGNRRTIWRKVKEAIVAIKLERTQSKDEILEAYLNTIYFGRGAYGIEAAARTYFGTGASSLMLDQAALIAGIIRSPESYDAARSPERARARRDHVLDQMAKLGSVTQAEADAAKATPVKVKPRSATGPAAFVGFHFVDEVRRRLVAEFGEDRVGRSGLVVWTTMDASLQGFAEDAVRSVLDRGDDPQAALVAVDPDTGAVLALVGGRTAEQEFNLATQGRRQAGSAFKPFVLGAALESGLSIRSRFDGPAVITLQNGSEPWKVENYDRRSYGQIDLVQATASSVNTVYAQLILKVGARTAAAVAADMGIASDLKAVPSLTLGTSLVTPLELAGAYATLATGGEHAAPYLIAKVESAKGDVLLEESPKPKRAVPDTVANTVTHALREVVSSGTGRAASLGSRPVAGKTGTTEDHVDAWFVGYTRRLATAVWMGFPEGGRTMEDVRGIAVTGGSFPARIWRSFMERATKGTRLEGFGPPSFAGEVLNPSPTPTPSPSPSPPVEPSKLPSLPPGATRSPKATLSPSPSPTVQATAQPT